ncbi:hypothetical protein PR048_004979 [Dryococelus australis]|uniref:Uncharacterized protein n=1 Tax=Dryococelus australis TaxID=614101 RepID=A0ABQ9I6X6_9NEOP|nr:hypothetical protein PR048_004979 [Dryococelus australis]
MLYRALGHCPASIKLLYLLGLDSTPVISEMDLVARITATALVIQTQENILSHMREAMAKCYNTCIRANGANFEHVL